MPATPGNPSIQPHGGDRPAAVTRTDPPSGRAWSYIEALAYLSAHTNLERVAPRDIQGDAWRLDRMKAILAELDHPHQSFKSVHIAGSKGKGSVAEMTAACLAGCGYRTGLYTSPHIVDLRERIRIDGAMIEESHFAAALQRVALASDAVAPQHGEPSYFELMTAMAFEHFARQRVDLAVIEVGLGGRLDSTNVITPEIAVLTAIQREHTQVLGETLEKIAFEKAGIIKPGVPAVTFQQADGVLKVFATRAKELGVRLWVVEQDWTSKTETRQGIAHISMRGSSLTLSGIPVPFAGDHQARNAMLALATLDVLRGRGLDRLEEAGIQRGMARTATHGRMEIISQAPQIMIDGAHTPDSVECLLQTLGQRWGPDRLTLVFGCAADKEVARMLRMLARAAGRIIFTKATDNPRAMDPETLLQVFQRETQGLVQPGLQLETAATPRQALELARSMSPFDGLICVTGSFYLAGEVKGLLRDV